MDYKKININQIPDEFYLNIKEEERDRLFEGAIDFYGSQKSLAEVIDTDRRNVYKWRRGKRSMPLDVLKKMCEKCGIQLESIQKSIISLKASRYSRHGLDIKLPLEVNEKWAYFSEIIRTDGHLTRDLKNIEIANNSDEVLHWIESFVNSLGIEKICKIPWNKGSRLKICNKSLATLLNFIFEIPKGSKSERIRIPQILFDSPKSVISNALKGAFDGDGFVVKRNYRIGMNSKSENYLKDVSELLSQLNIESYLRGPDSRSRFFLEISRFSNLKKYKSIIGFRNLKRRKSLERAVKKLSEEPHYSPLKVKGLVKEEINKGNDTTNKIAESLNRSADTIRHHLRELKSHEEVKNIKKGRKVYYQLE